MEQAIDRSGSKMSDLGLDELERHWQQAKSEQQAR
jgi:uncharacterized protein YabN with tetrapyrrole methylase and pyrophosphatase domain